MRFLLLAPNLVLAAPAAAQVAPAATNGIPNTPLSTSTDPSNGPRAREGDLPNDKSPRS